MATPTLPMPDVSTALAAPSPQLFDSFFSRFSSGLPVPWNWKTLGGLAALVVIWAAWFHGTWGAWGSLSVDCGREMYVPAVLSEGKTLYRDVWFNFGPAAPYFNGFLFRLFGVHLSVLYWAGSLSALGSAIFLYLCGMRLSSGLIGWTAAAALLFQAFHPTLFSFPLPYSFAAVYGCLIACLFLWLGIRGATSKSPVWIGAAGMAAAAGLLLKFEFGGTCYLTLALLILARASQQRSRKQFLLDLAATLPGLVLCGLVIGWMVRVNGISFLTQENFQSWPTAYFMKRYGKIWLETTGFNMTYQAFAQAAERTLILLGIFQGLLLIFSWRRMAGRLVLLRLILFLAALAFFGSYLMSIEAIRYHTGTMLWREALRYVFFPQDMVLYVAIAAVAAWWCFWRQQESQNGLAIAILFTFSALTALRILFKTIPADYGIYYNGGVVLSFLLITCAMISRLGYFPRFILAFQILICLGCLSVPVVRSVDTVNEFPRPAWLITDRGSIRLSAHRAEQYRVAIRFMKEKAALGESVLSVPEDTSLYFLSETHCPARVFAFTPGMLVPGKMTEETIQQIERNHVQYLIWSNRLFPEYGVMRFGKEFDQALGNYLLAHYRQVGPLTPIIVTFGEWNASIWERNTGLLTADHR